MGEPNRQTPALCKQIAILYLIIKGVPTSKSDTHMQRVMHATHAKIRSMKEIIEALSDRNRFYASEKLNRQATDHEAIMHYVENGGALDFRNNEIVSKTVNRHRKKHRNSVACN